jgi:CTP:molybdopterin cytidylyltransferase MocA
MLKTNAAAVLRVDVDDPGILRDIDTPGDLPGA